MKQVLEEGAYKTRKFTSFACHLILLELLNNAGYDRAKHLMQMGTSDMHTETEC